MNNHHLKSLPHHSRLCDFGFFALALASLALTSLAHAQDNLNDPPQAPRIRILGKIADGTPPLPAPPAVIPRFIVKQSFAAAKTEGHDTGTPQATFHEVHDPQLPEIEEPITSRSMSQEEWDAYRQSPQYAALSEKIARRKKMQIIMLSATIYDESRTQLRWWHKDRMHEAWSNVNFLHLGGFSSFAKDDQEYVLLMAASNISSKSLQKRAAVAGKEWTATQIPSLPESPETKPTFALVGEMPPEEAIAPITALHELYQQEHAALKAAAAGRKEAEIARAEELRRNPPKAQTPQIFFWRGKRDEATPPSTKQP